MKVNNTAEKSILNAQKLSKALSEGTEKTLKSLLNETISDIIKDDDEKEEKPVEEPAAKEVADDKDYNVEDVDDEGDDVADDDSVEDADSDKASDDEAEKEDASVEKDAADEDWSDFEDFKTDDNDYDFTQGEKEDAAKQLLKIFSVMSDDDQLIVTKDNDELTITDEDNDTEEKVNLEDGDADVDNDEIDIISDDDDEPTDDSNDDFEFDLDSEDDTNVEDEADADVDDEPENDEKEEDSFEFDVPDDEDDDDLHEEEEFDDADDLEEATNIGGAIQQRSASKSHVPAGRKAYMPKGSKHVSAGAEYNEVVESIKAENENLKKENELFKEGLDKLKKSLTEAAVLNVNLGQVVKLLVNETTTKDEKKSILNRFSNVKTIKEGKELYSTILTELTESAKKKGNVVLERQISADNTKSSLNETTFYQQIKNNPSVDLMNRMDNLFKGNKK